MASPLYNLLDQSFARGLVFVSLWGSFKYLGFNANVLTRPGCISNEPKALNYKRPSCFEWWHHLYTNIVVTAPSPEIIGMYSLGRANQLRMFPGAVGNAGHMLSVFCFRVDHTVASWGTVAEQGRTLPPRVSRAWR